MNKLAILEKNLPLRAYPENDLNDALTVLQVYVVKLLSLTNEDVLERLKIALPAIKGECIGMGFAEIKKMFDLYADNKLSIEPIPNYFDRILFGKIMTAYKTQKPKKTIKVIEEKKSKEEINDIMIEAIDRLKKEVEQNGYIDSVCKHVYDYLYKEGRLPKHTKEFKQGYINRAVKIAKSKAMTEAGGSYEKHVRLTKTIQEIEGINGSVKNICKRLILEDYFKN